MMYRSVQDILRNRIIKDIYLIINNVYSIIFLYALFIYI